MEDGGGRMKKERGMMSEEEGTRIDECNNGGGDRLGNKDGNNGNGTKV